MKKSDWHAVDVNSCLKRLNVDHMGLSSSEARERLEKYGENQIHFDKNNSILKKWINQFNNVLIYILIAAAIITSILQHWVDSSVIMGVVFLNALIGVIQESKAEKAIDALKKILSLKANVVRDRKRLQIDASEVVPGDIVLLRAGDKVPADMRLTETNALEVDESILTGESLPVEKNINVCDLNTTTAKQTCMAFSGTLITYGMAKGVVIATGLHTEIGRISSMLKRQSSFETPLLRQLARFGRTLAIFILMFTLFVFLFGVFIRHYPLSEMFMAAVAIAVSIIPEGLPAIITIALAIGVTRMAKRHAIIRRLASVETLSSVTVICTDKTGTLTKNELTVQKIITSDASYDVSGSGYNDSGKITLNNNDIKLNEEKTLLTLIRFGILCNEAELHHENNAWQLVGNPMDGALMALGLKANVRHRDESGQNPRADTIPFDSEHKFMASLHQNGDHKPYIIAKGAPEKIVSMCRHQLQKNQLTPINHESWSRQIESLAEKGMRVLAIAYRQCDRPSQSLHLEDIDQQLVLLGIVGIIDPPRDEAKDAVISCQRAGMTVKMVTGDHRLTAKSIAYQVGIDSDEILTGDKLNSLNDDELANIVDDIHIFARTVPEHKIRLIKALRARNHVVAMTGDGVNDAPALKSADIGIAMGIKGTDVAKEASEIVLADDNFASIKHTAEESRNVYNNLKKSILFILPSSGGEGFSIITSIFFGYTLPITPLQILWVNMITTVTLALALAFEKPEKNLMSQKPRDPNERLLSKFLVWRLSFVTLLYVLAMFGLFIFMTSQGANVDLARTNVVNILVFLEIIYLINCRRIYDSVLNPEGLFGSKAILIAIAIVTILQLGFTYLPFMQFLFKTRAVSITQWGVIFLISIMVFFIIELEKCILRKQRFTKHRIKP